MSRTKAEVRAFLDSLVGHTCVDKSDPRYNGQCVCLIKNLMEFLGVPEPYKGRGNAKDAGNAYIAQGIGVSGRGWLTIVVNKDMGLIDGVRYGHIWIDLLNETNYESNGARALVTTKGTRPISQGQQFVNFDKWIGEKDMSKITKEQEMVLSQGIVGYNPGAGYDYRFTGKETDQTTMDAFTAFWGGQAPIITSDVEKSVADGITGIKNVIGKDYNSQFVGQKIVTHYPAMVDFWISQKPVAPEPSEQYVPYQLPALFTKKEKK